MLTYLSDYNSYTVTVSVHVEEMCAITANLSSLSRGNDGTLLYGEALIVCDISLIEASA